MSTALERLTDVELRVMRETTTDHLHRVKIDLELSKRADRRPVVQSGRVS